MTKDEAIDLMLVLTKDKPQSGQTNWNGLRTRVAKFVEIINTGNCEMAADDDGLTIAMRKQNNGRLIWSIKFLCNCPSTQGRVVLQFAPDTWLYDHKAKRALQALGLCDPKPPSPKELCRRRRAREVRVHEGRARGSNKPSSPPPASESPSAP